MLKSNPKLLYKNIDAYLEAQPAWMQEALQRLRKVIIETAPKAEEHISYNMPTFKYYGALPLKIIVVFSRVGAISWKFLKRNLKIL